MISMALETPQQQIELFHLLFLRHLGEKVNKTHYALKGGCNLRFFFKSCRYSEDIDLDIRTTNKDTLKHQVNKLLGSSPFQQVLKVKGLSLADVRAAKQTDTTQRWKLKILGPATSLAIPTKIEFSRRPMDPEHQFESVDSELLVAYQLYPVLSNHYQLRAAFKQKVAALILRTETQARDLFDLFHLLERGMSQNEFQFSSSGDQDQAISNALSIGFSDYRSQVVAYLNAEYRDYFGTKEKWADIQERLIAVFEASQVLL